MDVSLHPYRNQVQSASVKDRTGLGLPDQTRNAVATTVSVPLAKWVNFASTGSSPQPGVYRSEATEQRPSVCC
jgi:hypothetical protein